MTDGPYLTGHPGTPEGLRAHLRFLPSDRKVEWLANIVGGNLLDLAEMAARQGGHLAPGIGDYPYEEIGCPSNEEVVRSAARTAKAAGRELAKPETSGRCSAFDDRSAATAALRRGRRFGRLAA